ncbi:fatty acid desaturase [bacterium]|nr:fatty acid desaturase [bacterium]
MSLIAAWAFLLITLLGVEIASLALPFILLGIALQTFLYTGLFITAHDGMHGLIVPFDRRLNDRIGTLAVWVYALFSYKRLMKKHWEHHRSPGDPEADPDFHDGSHPGYLAWYTRFFSHYVTIRQVVGMALVFNLLHHLAGVPLSNLLLFWVLPSLLSTVQLFTFGTYLPHRTHDEGEGADHHTRSNEYPVWLSFLTCYHFGYHLEHHLRPDIPWWALPEYRAQRVQAQQQ